MAAYAALVSLMNDLNLIPNHPTHSFSFDDKQISFLSQSVNFLVEFMESYDFHKCSREAVEILEGQITSAAHAAHDVIESHVVDQIHAGSTIPDGKEKSRRLDFVKTQAKKFGSTLLGNVTSYFMLDLQKAIDDLEFVKREVMQFKVQQDLHAEQLDHSGPTSLEPLTSSKKLMVGFEAVAVRLLDMLTGEPSSRRVIPIVGMGGIGKTTLAKYAYQHLLIQQHFDVCLWATISQKYSIETIFRQLLFREKSPTPGENFSRFGEELHKKLWCRRYLVVLDDVWSERAWDGIQMYLPDNGNGSCVIVTSRLSNLAPSLSSFPPFEMTFLDKDKSWELFCREAFGEEGCPYELDETGKEIVKRCRGLPLSIVVIGGHLRKYSRTILYWEKVANFMDPISSLGKDEQCLEIISLSYEHLPVYLKPCFLYMGVYPEDGWIDASELVKFWVAEGFIKTKKGMSLEEVAEGYLKDLVGMNLILVRGRRWDGKVEGCVIHDLVRELCLKVAKKENFLGVVANAKEVIGKERRIVAPEEFSPIGLPVMLRSLVVRGKFLYMFPDDLRLLRLLSKVKGYLYPSDYGRQLNLRFLAFSGGRPLSVYLMWNMQTLILHNYDDNTCEPFKIWEMTQLRHLEFVQGCIRDPGPGGRSSQLRNLHTLIGVENLRLTKEMCRGMPNIKKLSLRYNHLVPHYHGARSSVYIRFRNLASYLRNNFLRGDYEESYRRYDFPDYREESSAYYGPQNFYLFNKLESLHCYFSVHSKWHNLVLGLRLPSSLQELSLENSQLQWGELTTMIKSLSNLGSLALDFVRGPEWDLAEEEFCRLKVLRISRCHDLVSWKADSSNFPVLEVLQISEVGMLDEIPPDFGDISTLTRIELIGSSASLAVSALKIAAEQESNGNEDLEVDVGFWGKTEEERFHRLMPEENRTSSSLGLY